MYILYYFIFNINDIRSNKKRGQKPKKEAILLKGNGKLSPFVHLLYEDRMKRRSSHSDSLINYQIGDTVSKNDYPFGKNCELFNNIFIIKQKIMTKNNNVSFIRVQVVDRIKGKKEEYLLCKKYFNCWDKLNDNKEEEEDEIEETEENLFDLDSVKELHSYLNNLFPENNDIIIIDSENDNNNNLIVIED